MGKSWSREKPTHRGPCHQKLTLGVNQEMLLALWWQAICRSTICYILYCFICQTSLPPQVTKICNFSSEFWICPGVCSQWDMPRKQTVFRQPGGILTRCLKHLSWSCLMQRTSSSNLSFSSWYLWPLSFGHYLNLATKSEDWDNWWSFAMWSHQRGRCHTKPPAHHSFHLPVTCWQDSYTLKLLDIHFQQPGDGLRGVDC